MGDPSATEVADSGAASQDAAEQHSPKLSKNARKRLLKQQWQERKKAERRSAEKERRRLDLERRRREWDARLADAGEEEKVRLLEERKDARRERMGRRATERAERAARLHLASEVGQKVVIDLEFSELMASNEIHSLVHQLMFCYAVNGKCAAPAFLMLTGCVGEIKEQLQRLPGYERWILEKEQRSYIDVFEDQKEKLVYLTADSDTELDNLDLKKIYIIGGLVDRNRWKGITLKKAQEQGIQTARFPISTYLKLSSSQVLTVNQVFEVLLKFIETKDWKDTFFKVIPNRKRIENQVHHGQESTDGEECGNGLAEDLVNENEVGRMSGEEDSLTEDLSSVQEETTMAGGDDDEEENRDNKKTRLEPPENCH